MELQEFVSKAILDIINATETANIGSERKVELASLNINRTIEFDIAVSAEEKTEGGLHGGIKVLGFFEGGGGKSSEATNSTVSRIHFGVNVDTKTRTEHGIEKAEDARRVAETREKNKFNSAR